VGGPLLVSLFNVNVSIEHTGGSSHLVAAPFGKGLKEALDFAAVACTVRESRHSCGGGSTIAPTHRRSPPSRSWRSPIRCSSTRNVTPPPDPVSDPAPASAPEGEVAATPDPRTQDLGTITSSGTEATMRISDAADRVGVSSRTLRFYEELGLVSPSGHTAGGARRYAPEDLARIERIQELKDILGLGLDEIKEVLDTETRMEELRRAYRENARTPTAAARSKQKAILQEALQRREAIAEQLDRKMDRMASFRAKLLAESARTRELLEQFES